MNNKGFTLIELLVVVLIIGILAAIALPQYTKAVERSRLAEAVQWLGDVATAQQIYYMQNNEFAANLTNLNKGDIVVPTPSSLWSQGNWPIGTDGAVSISLERNSGKYKGGTIMITISPSGQVSKLCTTDAGGFCSLTPAMGYPSYLDQQN